MARADAPKKSTSIFHYTQSIYELHNHTRNQSNTLLEIHVFDVLGAIISQKINDLNENKIDVSQLSQSKYFVQLNTRIKKFSTVLIKK